jgi:type II secretory pathway pseudopilin PulG
MRTTVAVLDKKPIGRKIRGATIVELMLVIAIMALMIVFGVRQYISLKNGNDVGLVRSNVAALFQAMANYHRANCYGTFNPTALPAFTPGTLNPRATPTPTNPYPINIQTDLINNGFLGREIIYNPIVDIANDNVYSGYVLQFNRYDQTKYMCTTATTVNNCTPLAVGKIVTWTLQVAVKLANPATAEEYYRLLNGNCLSRLNGASVEPCSANKTGAYVVWEKTVNAVDNGDMSSPYWLTQPRITQFKNIYEIYNATHLLATQTNASAADTQYYLCGG